MERTSTPRGRAASRSTQARRDGVASANNAALSDVVGIGAESQPRKPLLSDPGTLQGLYELHASLARETDLHAALDAILATACEFTGTARGCVQLASEDGERLEMVAWRGYPDGSPFINHFRREGSNAACNTARWRQSRLTVEDIENFPPLAGTPDREIALAENIRATQSTPLISRHGQMLGVLSNQFAEPYRPRDDELRLLDMLAWTAVEFIERHLAQAALRASDRGYREMIDALPAAEYTTDAQGKLTHNQDIGDTMHALGERIAGHFGLSLCVFAEIDEATESVVIKHGWHRADVPMLSGSYRIGDLLNPEFERRSRDGKIVVVRDVAADPLTDAERFAALNFGAFIAVPLVCDGEWRFLLVACRSEPHDWGDDEINSLRELTTRIWTRLERARAEQALLDSEDKYRVLFESMDQGYCIIEVLFDEEQKPVDYGFIEVNGSFERQAGMHDVVGKRMLEFVPEIEPHWLENYGQVARTGKSIRFSGEYKGLERNFEVYAFRRNGWPQHHVAVLFSDVTESTRSDEALRSSEERLRLAQMAGRIGTTDYDINGDRMACSTEFYAIYGLPFGAEVTLATLLDMVHPDDRVSVAAALRESIRYGVPFVDEFRIRRAGDGEERWVAKRALAIMAHGKPSRLIGANIDVTERRRAEEAAKTGEMRVRAMFNQAAVGVFETDASMRMVMANARWCAMLGYSETDLLGRDLLEFVDPDFRAKLEHHIATATGGDPDFEIDVCFRCQDGTGVFATVAVNSLHGLDNTLLGMVGMALDITERNRIASALRESENRLQQALDAGSMGTFVWYPALDRIVDNGMLDMLGLNVDAALSMRNVLDEWVHEDDANRAAAGLKHACDPAGDGVFREDIRFVHMDGDIRWLAVSGQTRFDGDPPYAWYVSGVLFDISAEKRAETGLRELNEHLEELVAERTRELFASEQRVRTTASKLARAEQAERRRISQILHDDLQQQLHGMQMKVGMIRRRFNEGDIDGGMRGLDEVERWAGEGVQIARQLTTDLSPPIMKSEGLIETLGWLVGEMRDKHGLEVEVVGDRGVVMGDADLRVLLFQIVRELLFNIVKHASTDRARVDVECPDDCVAIKVTDCGRGFAADAGVEPRSDGGFGLFSVRERLALFGADMDIDSTPGAGTCITIKVPPGETRPRTGGQDSRSE